MMKKWMRAVSVLALVFGCAQGLLLAQQAPSYDETAAWIAAKFPELNGVYTGGGLRKTLVYTLDSMSACSFQYNTHITTSFSATRDVEDTYTSHRIDLAKVSSVNVSNIDGVLGVSIESSSQAYWRVGGAEWVPNNSSFIYTANPGVDNQDLAPRLVHALEHAVSICKTQAPKSNEPF
jgi:hypothetical protein